jgi:hypothetical protein
MNYGSKDLMRIQDIIKKADGDIIEEFKLAIRMANEIEIPGKAIARGYAAIEAYNTQYSPIAAIFFDRACQLSGMKNINDIQAMASANTVGGSDEEIETAYESVPTDLQPASRRPNLPKVPVIKRKGPSELISLAKINVVKGEGPNFNAFEQKTGTIEVWLNDDKKIRIVYTGNPDPTSNIGDEREFKYDGKRGVWTMVDYTEIYNMVHLQPLYGPSSYAYMYS